MRVVNLFRIEERDEAIRLYELAMKAALKEPGTCVELCRRIRARARAAGERRLVDATYRHEIEALFRGERHAVAWRQLKRLERERNGAALPDDRRGWPPGWAQRPEAQLRAGVAYALGKLDTAREAIEASVDALLESSESSFSALTRVCNTDPAPRAPRRVTLRHVYDALGRPLSAWSGWDRFVDGLHPRLLALAGLTRDELRAHPELLPDLVYVLAEEQRVRVTSGATRGELDLIQDRDEVRSWQHAKAERVASFRARTESRREELRAKLEVYFPVVASA